MKVFFLALAGLIFISTHTLADEHSQMIQETMWSADNQLFNTTKVPEKWQNESAVILAKLNRLEYTKPPIIAELRTNSIYHLRIKLNDKNAINEYAELSFPSARRGLSVYTGFKLIKPDGREVIIDNSQAVEMEMKERSSRYAYKKIAIPGLEEGDILDYYIYEEEALPLSSKMYYFDPVQHCLPQEYPVVEQRIEFKAQRRCFISLNSSNGAPQLTESIDEASEDITYVLVDKDREAVKDLRWFYPYRELPTIKFRAAYASGKAIRKTDVLLGEPGKVKSEVSNKELTDFLTYLLVNTYTVNKTMHKHIKKQVPKDAGNFEKAKAAFYFRRNEELNWDEVQTIADKDTWNQSLAMYKDSRFQSLDRFSTFLAAQKIPHDIVMAIPRDIASIDDLLLEHEIKYLLRVKEGDEYLYLSPVDNYRMPGEIDADLMGTEAFVVDGLAKFADWKPERITLPVIEKKENCENSQLIVELSDDFKTTNIAIETSLSGYLRNYAQYQLLDIYDYKEEESAKFKMQQDFEGTLWMKKKLLGLRESYLKTKEKNRLEALKEMTSSNYDFTIDTVADFKLLQSGRFDTVPDMRYAYSFATDELIKKAGNNYMLEIGKLIQRQATIEKEELERNHGIYMHSPRTYNYSIQLNIPDGYTIQGIEQLNTEVKNEQGGFISSARVEGNQLIVQTEKYYNNLYDEAATWPNYIAFLNAASNFSTQKILLKKL